MCLVTRRYANMKDNTQHRVSLGNVCKILDFVRLLYLTDFDVF